MAVVATQPRIWRSRRHKPPTVRHDPFNLVPEIFEVRVETQALRYGSGALHRCFYSDPYIVFAVIAIKLKRPDGKADDFLYAKKQVLFTPAERSFLGVLDDAVGKECRIFGKVRVADIAEPQPGLGKSSCQKAFNRISSKHFDFVLCDKNDVSIDCVVELDDKSHQQRKRQGRAAFLTELCQAIKLPFVQIPAQLSYSVAEIREKILAALKQCHEPSLNGESDQGSSSFVAAPHIESKRGRRE